jgi:ABC-type uncharacterized transport system involved in gliding motility auxiliary subunit
MWHPSRRVYAVTAIILAAAIFVGLNLALDATVINVRLDLTENGRFTLSQGTRNVIRNLKEPVRLRFYFSKKAASDYPQTIAYAGRVRDLLERYVALSGGKIILEEVDPEPYSPTEDEATANGLTPAPTDSGDVVYFGLAGFNRIDGRETIAYFSPDREAYLEYDLSSLIWRLATPEKPKLAILSGLPLETGAGGIQAMVQGRSRPFAVYSEIAKNYDVETLPSSFAAVPADAKVLMIVQPGILIPAQLYAIDQFVLKGGRVIVFLDPDCELAADGSPMAPAASSNLPLLLSAWGIGFNPAKVVGDLKLAQRVQTANDPRSPVALYPVWLHLSGDQFDSADPVTASLQTLNLARAGALFPLKRATTRFVTLVASSDRAGLIDAAAVRMSMRPDELIGDIAPAGKPLPIAARVTGPAATAFPGGPPPGVGGEQVKQARNINVVVMADADIFDDRFWVRSTDVYGKQMQAAFADNGAFVLGAIGNMMGSDDLISLRTRIPDERPFTVVRALQANAELQYRQEAEALQARLTETQSRLRDLETGAGGKAGQIAASAQQKTEIESFKRVLSRTRGALRDVQHNLRKDIDALGGVLAFVNIALVPLLVAAFAMTQAYLRRRRRRRALGQSTQGK